MVSLTEIEAIKSNLKAWIDDLSDTDMLLTLKSLRTANDYSWDFLSEYQKEHIYAGLKDIENGGVMSSAEFWNQIKSDKLCKSPLIS